MMKYTLSKGLVLMAMAGSFSLPVSARYNSIGATIPAASLPQSPLSPEFNSTSFRFMTYNIRNGKGMDNRTDYQRTADEILRNRADFVAVQEVDSATSRSNGRYVLGELAWRTQMFPVFSEAIPFDGGSYGIGLLCRKRPLSTLRVPMPGREEARTLLIAEFDSFYLACTHWSLNAEDRMASLEKIRQVIPTLKKKPLILAGDLNATPDSPEIQQLMKDFTLVSNPKKPTFPADEPNQTIDYIAVWKDTASPLYWSNGKTRIPEAKTVSDHRPIITEFRIKTPANRFFYGKPYLQNPTGKGITVMFQTLRPSHCWVEFTTDSLLAAQGKEAPQKVRSLIGGQVICHDIEQKIRLNHLKEGTTYYYRVCAQELLENQAYFKAFGDTVRTPYYRFTLPASDTEDFTAIILNDMHCSNQVEQKMSALVKTIPHDIVFFNGDCLPEPADREEAITNINRLAERFEGSTHPIFFIRGNHEIRNAYSSGMPSLFDNPAMPYTLEEEQKSADQTDKQTGWQVSTPREAQKPYGAFSWGGARFVYLDCGEDKPDDTWVYYGLNDFTEFRKEQAAFLKQETRSREFKRADRHILLGHIPLWGNTDKYQPSAALWRPILEKSSWDLGLFAHTHHFKYYETDSIQNPFPVYVGGGSSVEAATMAVIRKEGKKLTLKIYNAKGELLKENDL